MSIEIHKTAEVSEDANIGEGTRILKYAEIQKATVGLNCLIAEFAKVESGTVIENGVRIWRNTHVRDGVKIGENSNIGGNVYIDSGVNIGKNTKVQSNALIYHGTTIEDGVFVGPAVIFTNDKNPRAINPDGTLKDASDWEVGETLVGEGASIGAGSVILPGIKLGRFCLVGAGSVVTKDVPDFIIVKGNPARPYARTDEEGNIIENF